jgi:murein DD-endopeptidase MepM/ murein hydrolase activator NlpD
VTTARGWSTSGASRITLRPGETIASLSRRYGVPEKAILEVNGLSSASKVSAGQSVLIPTFSRGKPIAAAKPVAAPMKRPDTQAPARAAVKSAGGSYTVVSGDTLSAIAARTGASVTGIKQVNNLTTDNIRIGQRLLIPGLSADKSTETAKATNIDPMVTGSVKKASKEEKVAGYTPPKSAARSESGSITTIETRETAAAPEATGVSAMRWPVQGKVVSAFGSNSGGKPNDGIDISVPSGTAVKAAENGVVIYAGDGLKELGKTILVRHSDGVVTVYGHVSELNVKRGETVRRGQQIASSGMSGAAKQPQLHFEVRKNSKPVNPSTYLQ